jgi:hypothetical protein
MPQNNTAIQGWFSVLWFLPWQRNSHQWEFISLHWGKAQFLPNACWPARARDKHGKQVNGRAVNYRGLPSDGF